MLSFGEKNQEKYRQVRQFLIGEPQTMPDRVIAAAVIPDWKEFEPLRPKIVTWFSHYQSIPVQWQLQQNESCS